MRFTRHLSPLILAAMSMLVACGGRTVSPPAAPSASFANVQNVQLLLTEAAMQDEVGGSDNPCSSGSLGLSTRRTQSTFTTTLAPVNCQLASALAGKALLNGKPSLMWTTVFSAPDSGTATGPVGDITLQFPYLLGLIVDCTFPAPGTAPATTTFTNYGADGSMTASAYVCDNETYTTPAVTWSPTPSPTPSPAPTKTP